TGQRPQLSRPSHRSCRQRKIFELHRQRVETTDPTELLDSKQLTTDLEIRDFGYDHTALGGPERRQPLPASLDYRRRPGVREQAERSSVEQYDGIHQEIPLSSGGNSFRLEVPAASSAWKKSYSGSPSGVASSSACQRANNAARGGAWPSGGRCS